MPLLSSSTQQHSTIWKWIVCLSLCPLVSSRSALIRWLDQLRVEIPNQSFEAGFVHLYVNNLVCSHFAVEGIESQLLENDGSLEFTIRNVSATCHGSYRTSIHFVEGDMTASIGAAKQDRTALAWTVRLLDNTTVPEVLRPKGVETLNCQLGLAMTDLHFENGASTIFNLFHDMIESAINKQLACDKFQSIVDEQATAYITRAMQWLDPFIMQGAPHHIVPSDPTRKLASTTKRIPKRIAQFLQVTNDFIESHLNHGILPNATHCGGFAAGFNGLLQEHNSLSIHAEVELERSLPQNSTLHLRLSDWYLTGLNDWDQFVVLRPQKDDKTAQTTHLETQSDVNLTVSVEINITKPHQEVLTEVFDVTLSLTSLRAVIGTELGMNQDVPIGSIVKGLHNVTHFLPCLGLEHVHLQEADVDVDLVSLVVAGSSSSVSRPREGHSHHGGHHHGYRYQDRRLDGHECLPDRRYCDASLEEDMDELITHVFELVLRQYPNAISRAVAGLVKGPGAQMANKFFAHSLQQSANCTLETENNHHSVNFTKTPLLWANEQLNRSLPALNEFIDCTIQVVEDRLNTNTPGSIGIQNLGSFQELDILNPENSTLLSTAVVWGSSDESMLLPSTEVNIQIPDVLTGVVGVTIEAVEVDVTSLLEYDRNRLLHLELSQLLSQCIALPVEELSFPVFHGSIQQVEINATISLMLDANRSLTVTFDSTEYSDFTSAIHKAVAQSVQFLQEGVDWGSGVALQSSRKVCGAPNDYDQDQTNTMILILSALFVLAQPLIMLMRRGRFPDETPQTNESSRNSLVEPLIHSTFERQFEVCEVDSLMNQSGKSTQYLVPITIVFTMGLFLASNISVGASVEAASKYNLPSLYDFGLVNTAQAMLNAKVYPLFLLVVVFSGAWPYAKLLLMLVAWICPTDLLSFQTRESLLTKLDALSKYSLVDTYVLVAFLDSSYALDVYVVPKFGFYGFLLATMISLGLGHVLVAFHRQSAARSPHHEQAHTYESVFGFTFSLSDGSSGRLSVWFRIAFTLSMLGAMGLIGYGSTKRSFIFKIGGVAGYLLDQRSVSSFSLLSIGAAIPKSVPGGLAVYFLQASYYFYTVVTPFAALSSLLILMLVPAVPGYQARMLVFAEVANAWSAIEVFVVSIVAAVFQVSQFSRFIVGDRCDFVGRILENNDIPDSDCFSVKCTVSASALFLILGALMYTALVWIALRIARVFVASRRGEGRTTGETIDVCVPKQFLVLAEQDISMPPVVSESIAEESETSGKTWAEWKETTNVT